MCRITCFSEFIFHFQKKLFTETLFYAFKRSAHPKEDILHVAKKIYFPANISTTAINRYVQVLLFL